MLLVKLDSGACAAGTEMKGHLVIEVKTGYVSITRFAVSLETQVRGQYKTSLLRRSLNLRSVTAATEVPGIRLERGVHEIPFVLQVPADAWPTCTQELGGDSIAVSHTVEAKAVRAGLFSFNLKSSESVVVDDASGTRPIDEVTTKTFHHKAKMTVQRDPGNRESRVPTPGGYDPGLGLEFPPDAGLTRVTRDGEKGKVDVRIMISKNKFKVSEKFGFLVDVEVKNRTPFGIKDVIGWVEIGMRFGVWTMRKQAFSSTAALLDSNGRATLAVMIPDRGWRNFGEWRKIASFVRFALQINLNDGDSAVVYQEIAII